MAREQLLVMYFGSATLTEDKSHPNKMKFQGVLVRLDEPSTKAPNGSEGHRILVPTAVAKKRLGSLINMGLNYAQDLDGHAQRRKVGTITKAWISGQDLHVEGVVWKHDFPEAEHDLKQPGLGMSMEIGDVQVADESAPVWKLSDFCFLGATILWKRSAAYQRTQAIAAKGTTRSVDMVKTKKKNTEEVKPLSEKKIVAIAASAAKSAVEEANEPLMTLMKKAFKKVVSIGDRVDALEMEAVSAASGDDEEDDEDINAASKKAKGEEEDEEEACDMTSAKKGDDDDDDDECDDEDDMDAETVDKGDLEDMGPETEDDEDDNDEPGHLSQGAKNKGAKQTSEDKLGKDTNEPITGSALRKALKAAKQHRKEKRDLLARIALLEAAQKKQRKQIKAASDTQGRKSMMSALDPMTAGLLSKSGIDAREVQASGQKLTVAEVDAILAAGGVQLDNVTRMQFKNNLLERGMMEQGGINRGIGV